MSTTTGEKSLVKIAVGGRLRGTQKTVIVGNSTTTTKVQRKPLENTKYDPTCARSNKADSPSTRRQNIANNRVAKSPGLTLHPAESQKRTSTHIGGSSTTSSTPTNRTTGKSPAQISLSRTTPKSAQGISYSKTSSANVLKLTANNGNAKPSPQSLQQVHRKLAPSQVIAPTVRQKFTNTSGVSVTNNNNNNNNTLTSTALIKYSNNQNIKATNNSALKTLDSSEKKAGGYNASNHPILTRNKASSSYAISRIGFSKLASSVDTIL